MKQITTPLSPGAGDLYRREMRFFQKPDTDYIYPLSIRFLSWNLLQATWKEPFNFAVPVGKKIIMARSFTMPLASFRTFADHAKPGRFFV